MNKFCTVLGIIILGIVNIYSGCCCKNKNNSNKTKTQGRKPDLGPKIEGEEENIEEGEGEGEGEGGEEGGEEGEGEGEENIEEGEQEGEQEAKKTRVINDIGGYINYKKTYTTKNLNEFDCYINKENKVVITLGGGHFTATSVNDWDKIDNYEEAVFTISVKTNNNEEGLYWKFEDDNEITLENLRNSLAKIGDPYREDRKSHYLCVKNKKGILQDGRDCFIDLLDGIIYTVSVEGQNTSLKFCNLVSKYNKKYNDTSSNKYYWGTYYKNSGKNKSCNDNNGATFKSLKKKKHREFAPTEVFLNDIGKLTIVTE